jgi:hypothetical protein
MSRPRSLPVDPARLIGEAVMNALATALPSNAAAPAWRTLAAEGSLRGFPSTRAFREWCYRVGVPIREVGGVPSVAPADVDRVFAAAEDRPTPPSALPSPEPDEAGTVKQLLPRRRQR